jgi:hypothetical protein
MGITATHLLISAWAPDACLPCCPRPADHCSISGAAVAASELIREAVCSVVANQLLLLLLLIGCCFLCHKSETRLSAESLHHPCPCPPPSSITCPAKRHAQVRPPLQPGGIPTGAVTVPTAQGILVAVRRRAALPTILLGKRLQFISFSPCTT